MTAWDAVDIGIVVAWLAWMAWFWWTVSGTLLRPGCPRQVIVGASIPVIAGGVVLTAISGLLMTLQGAV